MHRSRRIPQSPRTGRRRSITAITTTAERSLSHQRNRTTNIELAAKGRAQAAIRAAYADLAQASVGDGKNIDDQPPAQLNWGDHRGRLHEAEALLHRAHDDVVHKEDNPAARGLRDCAVRHIDQAGRLTDAAIMDRGF